jgi:hypothetical protein
MQAIEPSGVIEMARSCLVNRVVVAAKQNDLAFTALSGNQCGMNSNNTIR